MLSKKTFEQIFKAFVPTDERKTMNLYLSSGHTIHLVSATIGASTHGYEIHGSGHNGTKFVIRAGDVSAIGYSSKE